MLFLNENVGEDVGGKLFAELDQMVANEETIIGEDFDVFDGDAFGGAQICLEMETSWNALTMDMASIEHNSIVNEDEALLEASLKGFWDTIVKWAKKIWASISGFFKKVWNMITSVFKNNEKWIVDNKSKFADSVTFKCSSLTASGNLQSEISAAMKDIEAEVKNNMSKEEGKDAKGGVKGFKKELMGEKKESPVKTSTLVGNVTNSGVFKASLKNLQTRLASTVKQLITTANAAKNASDKDGAKEKKKEISGLKRNVSFLQMETSMLVSVNNKVVSQSMSGLRKSMSAAKE